MTSPLVLPSGLGIERDFSLKSLTSWLVGGNADFLSQPKTVSEVIDSLQWAKKENLPVSILGGGTNVLISDDGVRGFVLALRRLAQITTAEVDRDGVRTLEIQCLAGTSKSELLKTFLKNRLEPALFLAGLPGDVGGGVTMNAGVGEMITPREFTQITDWVEVVRWSESGHRFELVRLEADQLQWSYRHCKGWEPGVIVRVGLSWPLEQSDDILPRVKQANQTRLSKQPLDMPSCGSVFVNPPGHKSGQLIESCGLKGFTIGGAKVSEKHANFIVNFNEAKASDIDEVIKHVQDVVFDKHGVELKTEVVYLGEWP